MKYFTVILLQILGGAEIDLFVPSFPELQRVFNLSPFLVQLTLSVNFIAYCVSSLIMGVVGDRYNRRHVMLTGLFLFVVGSICCSFAQHFYLLLVGRFLQGIGIAAPVVLAYLVVADDFTPEEQQRKIGIISGVSNLAMAMAPLVGSYINLYFNWRGNFFFLLVLGGIGWMLTFLFVPAKAGHPSVRISFKSYVPLLCSPKVIIFCLTVCFLVIPYWIAVGMTPILFMEDWGLPLTLFGFYQGGMCCIYALLNLWSPWLLQWMKQKYWFMLSAAICAVTACMIMVQAVIGEQNPLMITITLTAYSASLVFPIVVIYPYMLEILPHARGRITAFFYAIRLTLTAIGLEIVSYFHQGTLLPLAISMCICLVLALSLGGVLFAKGWLIVTEKEVKGVPLIT